MSISRSAGRAGAQAAAQDAPVWTASASAQDAANTQPEGEPVEQAPVEQTPPAAHPTRRRSGSVSVLLSIAALIAAAGIAFAAGRATAPSGSTGLGGNGNDFRFGGQVPNASFVPGADGGFGGFGDFEGRNRIVSGTVVSVGSGTITVKLADGQTVTIATTSSTTYNQQTAASASDVAAGQTVTIQTSGAATSGSTTRTATTVTITSK